MNFRTHNQVGVNVDGTHLQGEIRATFADLCAIFGEPMAGDGHKVDAEWHVRFEDDTVATIYNWKDGVSYCGPNGTPIWQIKKWHVGGHSKDAVYQVLLQTNKEMA